MPFSNTISLANTFADLVDVTNQLATYINDNLVHLVPVESIIANGTLYVNSTATFNGSLNLTSTAATINLAANVSLNTSALFIGNSSVNTIITTSTGKLGAINATAIGIGVAAPSAGELQVSSHATIGTTSDLRWLNSTRMSATGNGLLRITSSNETTGIGFDILTDGVAKFRNRAQNADANITFGTANASVATSIGANVTLNTSALLVGNSTVNTVVNSTGFAIGTRQMRVTGGVWSWDGGSAYPSGYQLWTASATGLTVSGGGISVTDSLYVGTNANVALNTSALFIGNTTVNTVMNSSVLTTATINASSYNGATIALTTSANIGANVSLSTSALLIGNSTVNTTHNSSVIAFNGTLVVNSSILNIATVNAPTINAATVTTTGDIIGGNNVRAAAGGYFYFNGRAVLSSPAVGQMVLLDNTTAANGVGLSFTQDGIIGFRNRALNADANITFGTANASVAVSVGANATLNTSALVIGNSTVNTIVTLQTIQTPRLGVGVAPSGTDGVILIPAAGYFGYSTRSFLRSPSNGHFSFLTSDESAGVRIDHSVDGVLRLRNRTDAADANLLANFINASSLNVGTFSATSLIVGANVSLNTSALLIGNSTVNTVINSTSFATQGYVYVGGTTVNQVRLAHYSNQTLTIETGSGSAMADVKLNTLYSGNGTSNSVLAPTGLTVGNSTVNTVVNSTSILMRTAGPNSYTNANSYLVWSNDQEYSVVDTAGDGATWLTMKTFIPVKTGTFLIKFSAYITSGSNYWQFRIRQNGTNTLASGHYNNSLDAGETSSVHAYRRFIATCPNVSPGDVITLEMVSSDSGGGTPQVGDGTQTLYAKEFRVYSGSPTVEANTDVRAASLAIGANVSLNTSALLIGNSTVNTTQNSSTILFNGAQVMNSSVLNIATVNTNQIFADSGGLFGSGANALAINTGSGTRRVRIWTDIGDGIIRFTGDGTGFNRMVFGPNDATGLALVKDGSGHLHIQGGAGSGYRDVNANTANLVAVVVGANVSMLTDGLRVGNSTVNSIVNSSSLLFNGGVTVNASLVNVATMNGSTLTLSTSATVGANVTLNTSALLLGNSTVNTRINSSSLSVSGAITAFGRVTADSTSGFYLSPHVLLIGSSSGKFRVVNENDNAGVLLDVATDSILRVRTRADGADANFTAGLITGSTSVNTPAINAATLVLSTSATIGANVSLTTGVLSIGNSTVNTTINSTAHLFNGTLFANSTIINIPTVNAPAVNASTLVLSTSATLGANVTLNTSALLVGNSTVNTVVNSSSITARRYLSPVVTLTDGATPALDASLGEVFRLDAAGDRTIAVPSNPTAGQRITIMHYASGGARTLALNTGTNGFRYGTDITALTQTASGKTDYIGAQWNATDSKWDVVAYAKGF